MVVPLDGLRVGTSGWHYGDWRGEFYPRGLPARAWLGYYASRFTTVEVNSTFYRLPEASTVAGWKAQTPAGFVFTVKSSRFLTHYRRLADPGDAVERLLGRVAGFGEQLGPVLLQLPPDFRVDVGRLRDALDAFDGRVRLVCEFRHPSWYRDDVYAEMEARDVALCLADRRNRHGPLVRTASWTFLRMHEGTASPAPAYGPRALAAWAGRLRALFPAEPGPLGFVYFNNDHGGAAVRDAGRFASIAAR